VTESKQEPVSGPMAEEPRGVALRAARAGIAGVAAGLLAFGTLAAPYSLGRASAAEELPIGRIQGVVGDEDRGSSHVSPLQRRTVRVRGVVHQLVDEGQPSRPSFGFLIQEPEARADGDPRTSDGIYVRLGRSKTLRPETGSPVAPRVGDELVLEGRVEEYRYRTQLSRPVLVERVRRGVDLDEVVPAVPLALPADFAAARRVLERLEGMRVRLPAGAVVQGGRKSYDEIFVSLPSRRATAEGYGDRIFRDAHPLDNVPEALFDDGNGDRVAVSGAGLSGAGRSAPALPAARTFDRLSKPVTGGLFFSYGKYQVLPAGAPELRRGLDPSSNRPPAPPVRPRELSIAVYNIENLYDLRNDPDDANDHPGDPGAGGIRKPFNYLPPSEEAYRERLRELASQIVTDLHAPEILMIQEVEDQDLLAFEGSKAREGANGAPDILEELAVAIARLGGPTYAAALDRDGADVRGIVCGYLYRGDRVRLAGPSGHPVLDDPLALGEGARVVSGSGGPSNPRAIDFVRPEVNDPDDEGGGRTVFSRPPQVAWFEVFEKAAGEGTPLRIHLVNNHLSSRPRDRVEQRELQAAGAARIARAILERDPAALVAVGGDLNVFPRPDDPFVPGEPSFPSDQLAELYEAGLANLHDRMLAEHPEAAYTYVYQGQAQTLDQLFVSPALADRVVEARVAHVNCDWPADHPGDGPRGLSDHDPLVVRIRAF